MAVGTAAMTGCVGVGQALPQKHASSANMHDAGGIDRVHVVWMNHLDVGFTNNIASVLNIYFHEYFTKAIETAKEVNRPFSLTRVSLHQPRLAAGYLSQLPQVSRFGVPNR